MRGGITLTEAYDLSPEDRDIIGKIVDDNYKTTEKTKLPHF